VGQPVLSHPFYGKKVMIKRKFLLLLFCFMITGAAMADFEPFATEVINVSLNGPNEPHYLPAPGYYIDDELYNDSQKAIGPPLGNGTGMPNNNSVVSLGGFGGNIVLAFDHDVKNDPANHLGLDAIVFSNAFWYNGLQYPNHHWSEPATIEIMPELNNNNIPGDDPCEIWYVIPGSNLPDNTTWKQQHWDFDDDYYPQFAGWPYEYDTSAFELFPNYKVFEPIILLVNPCYDDSDPCNNDFEGFWGYAEYTPTLKIGDRDVDDFNDSFGDCPNMPPELFYTIPDDPFLVGIDSGSGGGDAFDISWAIDPCSWLPAKLQSFRYIRLTTAVSAFGFYSEMSSEIDAVSDVRPYGDINGDDEVDLIDLDMFSQTWLSQWPQTQFNPAADFIVDHEIDFKDFAKFAIGFKP
jgi:hypothetical protein